MTGMRIEGGNWSDSNEIVPIGEKEDIGKALPPMLMRWSKVASKTVAADEMLVPVYLNRTRKNLIMSLKVKMLIFPYDFELELLPKHSSQHSHNINLL